MTFSQKQIDPAQMKQQVEDIAVSHPKSHCYISLTLLGHRQGVSCPEVSSASGELSAALGT